MSESSQTFDPGVKRNAEVLEKILSTSGLSVYDKEKSTLLSWRETKINIAVVGHSGAGKSTFINEFLELDDDGEDVAITGEIETTKTATPFTSKKNENVTFWDLPGVGTPTFKKETYVQSNHLGQFDYFLILSRGRFTEEDVWLAKYVEKTDRKYYFIRTHIEEDLENDEQAHPTTHVREKVLADIRKYCKENLEKAGLQNQDIFLVDNFERKKHDFPCLFERLIVDADEIKACIMAACIAPVSLAILERKKELLQERIKKIAMKCQEDYNTLQNADEAKQLFINECALYRGVYEVNEVKVRQCQNLFQLSQIEISKKLQELQELNQSSGFLCGFTITPLMLLNKGEMFSCVALLLFDYLERLHDIAIKIHVDMLSPEVLKKLHV